MINTTQIIYKFDIIEAWMKSNNKNKLTWPRFDV